MFPRTVNEKQDSTSAWGSTGKKQVALTKFFVVVVVVLAFFLIRYFLYLHFKCYPKSPLYLSPALLPNPPTTASWPWHSPVLGHIIFIRPRASHPIDDQLGHPLLHMQLETQALGGKGCWLVHIVVPPIGLQTPLAPWVLSLSPSLGALCSIQ